MNKFLNTENECDELAVLNHVLQNLGEIPPKLEFLILRCNGDETSLKMIKRLFWPWFDQALSKNRAVVLKGLREAGYLIPDFQTLDVELHSGGWFDKLLEMVMVSVMYA